MTTCKLLIFINALLLLSYFYNPNLSNQNSRLNVIIGSVHQQFSKPLFNIDRYIYNQEKTKNTLDWAYHNNHYFSNKAPGTMLIGIPLYMIIFKAEQLFGYDPYQPYLEIFNAYLLNFLISVVPFALALMCFLEICLRTGASWKASILMNLCLLILTPLLAYNTQLWGINTSTSFSIIALYYVIKNHNYRAGFFLGLAVICDHLAILSAGTIFIYSLFRQRFSLLPLLPIILGALPLVLLNLWYNQIVFDSLWSLSAAKSNQIFMTESRFLGMFGKIDLSIIQQLLVGTYRGLFLYSPIFLLSLLGIYDWLKKDYSNTLLLLCLGLTSSYLLTVSAFNGWHGGSTVTARYLLPIIPFLILPLRFLDYKNTLIRFLTFALVLISLSNSIVSTFVSPLVPEDITTPLFNFTYVNFMQGNIAAFKFPILLHELHPEWLNNIRELSAWNLGQVILGLRSYASTVPWLLYLLCSVILFLRLSNHEPQRPQRDTEIAGTENEQDGNPEDDRFIPYTPINN